jgi:hypothetical protein
MENRPDKGVSIEKIVPKEPFFSIFLGENEFS